MSVFTSSLPDEILIKLEEKAQSLSVPKNKIIENALRLYLEHLERQEYINSYKKSKEDPDIQLLAEEGMEDYLRQIEE
jgi:predicted transcriptional regulator